MKTLETYWNKGKITTDWYGQQNFLEIEFAPDLYQFQEDSEEYNERTFEISLFEMKALYMYLFEDASAINVIVETENVDDKLHTKVFEKAPIVFGDVLDKEQFEIIEHDSFPGADDAYTVFKQQITFQNDFETLKDSALFEMIVNRDFSGRSPRWILDNNTNHWDVYIVSDKVIYNPFDDRGACIMFRDDSDYQKFVIERAR